MTDPAPLESTVAGRGRPPSTTHAEVERAAFALFAERGFDATTMDDIAGALGIGRRTLFRYFPSKNDIVWGDFDLVLERLRGLLAAADVAEPVMTALARAIVESNRYDPDQLPELRVRMALITSVPALQAHSMLRYAAWREVVAEFVAARRGEDSGALIPQTVGHLALGVSMSAFSHWVAHPDESLDENLARCYALLEGMGVEDTRG